MGFACGGGHGIPDGMFQVNDKTGLVGGVVVIYEDSALAQKIAMAL